MSDEKNVPANCFECEYASRCHAPYYGSTLCKYHREIEDHIIEITLRRERGG